MRKQVLTTQTIKCNKWKALHNVVVGHADNGEARSHKANVWKSLDTVFKLCDLKVWKKSDHHIFKNTSSDFKTSMVGTWTNEHITDYIEFALLSLPCFNMCVKARH